MSSSRQHDLDTVRRPRVQITYDVETNGALKKVELPFVVGVLADLSGKSKADLPKMDRRDFVDVTPETFNKLMEGAAPKVAMLVDNKLTNDGSKLSVELNFRNLDDFGPLGVTQQVEPLRELVTIRRQLESMLARADGNDSLRKLLAEVIKNTEDALAKAKGGAEGKEAAQ
jgi:type VI secretion system protein ImpB